MSLRIGRIAYLNVVPYFHCLAAAGFTGEVVSGVPAELNRLLAAGAIDACPSSSFEYGLHADDYLLLPGHSISSIGPVHSVLLFCRGSLRELNGASIALTGESATSVNLLKILLHEFCGIREVACQVPATPIETALEEGRPTLLIGDRALKAARRHTGTLRIFDLGELWHQFTGLPFVFALWILRKAAVAADPPAFQEFARQLAEARRRAFAQLEQIAGQLADRAMLSADELVRYWRGMSYDLGAEHQAGLRLYFALCVQHGLLVKAPELEFLEPSPTGQRVAR